MPNTAISPLIIGRTREKKLLARRSEDGIACSPEEQPLPTSSESCHHHPYGPFELRDDLDLKKIIKKRQSCSGGNDDPAALQYSNDDSAGGGSCHRQPSRGDGIFSMPLPLDDGVVSAGNTPMEEGEDSTQISTVKWR